MIHPAWPAGHKPHRPLTPIELYAIKMVSEGAESSAEDDLDEDGEFEAEDDHTAACDLAVNLAKIIRDRPEVLLRELGVDV